MEEQEKPDVFFSYNTDDEVPVLEIFAHVTARGLKAWLDKPHLRAGYSFITSLEDAILASTSAAVLIGSSGVGKFQRFEVHACIQESTKREFPVIPVLIAGAPSPEDLPPILRSFHCVDLRDGISDRGIDRLVWGVLGVQATEINRDLLVARAKTVQKQTEVVFVDPMGIASIKSRMHALSEIVAQAAVQCSAQAVNIFPEDILSVVLPVMVEMRWRRGYAAAIEKMLKIPEGTKYLGDFACESVAGCSATEGVLSANREEHGWVLVSLDGKPAVRFGSIPENDAESVVESIELYGRLGVPSRGGMSTAERIGEVQVRVEAAATDETAAVLFQNREILAPLLAQSLPSGLDWLVAEDESYGAAEQIPEPQEAASLPESLPQPAVEESFDARTAFDTNAHAKERAYRRFLANLGHFGLGGFRGPR